MSGGYNSIVSMVAYVDIGRVVNIRINASFEDVLEQQPGIRQ